MSTRTMLTTMAARMRLEPSSQPVLLGEIRVGIAGVRVGNPSHGGASASATPGNGCLPNPRVAIVHGREGIARLYRFRTSPDGAHGAVSTPAYVRGVATTVASVERRP